MQSIKTERIPVGSVILVDVVDHRQVYKIIKLKNGVRISTLTEDDEESVAENFLDAYIGIGKPMKFVGFPKVIKDELRQPSTLISGNVERIEYYEDC